MDDKAIRRTIRGLQKEADELDHEAEKRRTAIRHLEELLPPSERRGLEPTTNGRSASAGNGQPPRASDSILQVMYEAGRPMTLTEIRNAIRRKGWTVPKSLHETVRRLKEREKIKWVAFSTYEIADSLIQDSGAPTLSRSGQTTPG